MQLLIRQKYIQFFAPNFTVTDEVEPSRFQIESHGIIAHSFDVKDGEGNIIFVVKRRLFRLLPRTDILSPSGELLLTVKSKFTIFKKKQKVINHKGTDVYTIENDLFAHEYIIRKNGETFAGFNKKYISFVDTYTLTIVDDDTAALCVAFMLAIDSMHHSTRKTHSSSIS